MRLKKLLTETSMRGDKLEKIGPRGHAPAQSSIDGLSKQRAKTMLYKQIKPFHINRLYKDDYWEGPKNVWTVFDQLGLNWAIDKSEYQYDKTGSSMTRDRNPMPVRKVWWFTIWFDNDKGKQQKFFGHLTAAGAGSVEDPLDKYDLVVILS